MAVSSEKGGALKAFMTATKAPPPEQSSLAVDCLAETDAIELLVTDPKGRRTGDDPIARQAYDEFPAAYYESAGIDDDESNESESNPAKTLYIPNPIPGRYVLSVSGTATSSYRCEFLGYDLSRTSSKTRLDKIQIHEGDVQKFTVEFEGRPGSPLRVSGVPSGNSK